MQTIRRPLETGPGPARKPPWLPGAVALGSVVLVALIVFAIMNKWGVLLLTIALALAGLGIWVWQRGFRAIEIVAFLIHFDGLEFSIISVGRISAAVLTFLLIHKIFVQRWRPPAVQWKNWFPIWLMVSWVTVSGLWSQRAGGFIKAFLMLYLALVFFAVTSMLVENHQDVQRFLRAFWVGGLFGSASGILALFLGTRSEGLIGDPNFFGLVQASMIPLTVYYLRHATKKTERWFYLITLAVVLGGAAGAGSRSGLIGASIAIVATMVARPGISMQRRAKMLGVAMVITPIAFAIGFVANPANLQRGFADRGAGRLDFWNVTVDLISERPLLGQGFGQLYAEIPQRLLVTPGVQLLDEKRDSVSSHNTWLDMAGDAGFIGLGLFILCFVIAMWSLARPRWPYMSDLSSTVLIMLLPVLSSSLFLGLLNNKLAWSIMGLAAALSIPSESSRWSGLTGDSKYPLPPPEPDDALSIDPGLGNSQRQVGAAVPGATPGTDLVLYGTPMGQSYAPVRYQTMLANPMYIDEMPPVELARWDLRFTRTRARIVGASAVVAAIVVFMFASSLPPRYLATTGFVAPELDLSVPAEIFRLPVDRSQKALSLVKSPAYAANLQSHSGVDLTVEEIMDRITVEKPAMGGLVTITFTDADKAVVEQVSPYLLAALNDIYTQAREFGSAGVGDQVRPINPGEKNYYDGPPLVAAFSSPVVEAATAKKTWMALVAGVSAVIIVGGLFLSGCRRPRVRADDDIEGRTSTPVIGRVALARREPAGSAAAQVQQVSVAARDLATGPEPLRRIYVAPPERSEAARRLTIDLAAAFVVSGERVVVVDADLKRPWLSLRLHHGVPRPSADAPLALHAVKGQLLTRTARKLLGSNTDGLRLLSGTQIYDSSSGCLIAERLGEFDEGVTVIVVGPPAGSSTGTSELIEWAQAILVPVRTGLTTTEATQLATSRVNLLRRSRSGVVLLNS